MKIDLELLVALAIVVAVLATFSHRVEGAERIPKPDRVVQGVDKTGTKAWVCSYWDSHPAIDKFCVTFVKVSK